jgi:hypothetical protein
VDALIEAGKLCRSCRTSRCTHQQPEARFHPTGAIYVDADLTPAQVAELRARWHGGAAPCGVTGQACRLACTDGVCLGTVPYLRTPAGRRALEDPEVRTQWVRNRRALAYAERRGYVEADVVSLVPRPPAPAAEPPWRVFRGMPGGRERRPALRGWRERFVTWWCGHASAAAAGWNPVDAHGGST